MEFVTLTSEQQRAKIRSLYNALTTLENATERVITVKEELENSDLEYTAPTTGAIETEQDAILALAVTAFEDAIG